MGTRTTIFELRVRHHPLKVCHRLLLRLASTEAGRLPTSPCSAAPSSRSPAGTPAPTAPPTAASPSAAMIEGVESIQAVERGATQAFLLASSLGFDVERSFARVLSVLLLHTQGRRAALLLRAAGEAGCLGGGTKLAMSLADELIRQLGRGVRDPADSPRHHLGGIVDPLSTLPPTAASTAHPTSAASIDSGFGDASM